MNKKNPESFKKLVLSFVCCPECKSDLMFNGNKLYCPFCKKEYKILDNIPILLPNYESDDIKLSLKKWDGLYRKQFKKEVKAELKDQLIEFEDKYLNPTLSAIKKYSPRIKNQVYMEIGCGPFFIGVELARQGAFVVGIDFSFEALKIAKYFLESARIKNYLLICGDITKMPLKNEKFDLLYGGGVIEHFEDTKTVVSEIHRILRKNGISFNTVPLLNLGSLTYRQIWGNIPNISVLKQAAEFIHIKILKARHMTYGYELSFTKYNLRNIFKESGFKKKNIVVENFQTTITLDYIKNALIKRFALFLIFKTPFFWPVVYVMARR